MARFGVSPTRNKRSDYQPSQVTAAVLTYLPQSEGYYRHRLDVLRLCLESLIQTSAGECDLIVFDNGSGPEVVDYLRSLHLEGKIDVLMLSARNLGKIDALQMIFNAARGEYIAYCDDDILFYPGWLQAHLDIFKAFPDVGVVSGTPVRDAARQAVASNEKFLAAQPTGLTVRSEHWIPDEWDLDWAESTGRDVEKHYEEHQGAQDPRWEMNGVGAFPAANHFQFVAAREVILNALPDEWSGRLMGKMTELDQAIDAQEVLRLSTTGRFVRHIGNAVSPKMAAEAKAFGIDVKSVRQSRREKKHWILHIPGMRPRLKKLYGKLFDILYHVRS